MIKLPDTPAERLNIGDALSFAALKTAIEQLVGANGLPMVVEVTEVKPAGFLRDSVEGLVISHATEPRKYSKAVLTQEGSGLSTRLMVYYVGTDKYTRNMRAAEITRRDHAIMSGITRMLNADKAQQQEMYYEDMAQVVLQAIDMVQRGAVRATAPAPAPTRTATPAPSPARSSTQNATPAPAAHTASNPQPQAPRQQAAPRSTSAPHAPAASHSQRQSTAPSRSSSQRQSQSQSTSQPGTTATPQPTPQAAPRPTTVPLDQVEGPRTTAICTCPYCGAKVRVTVPKANCQVSVTCGKCHQKFPLEVRRKS